MIEKEIEHLKKMKVNVPPEWATERYVLLDEHGGWPWDKEKFPDGGLYTAPPSREPGSTIKRMLELVVDDKIPIVIISEIIIHKRESQTMRYKESKEMMALSRVCILLIEREAGRFERIINNKTDDFDVIKCLYHVNRKTDEGATRTFSEELRNMRKPRTHIKALTYSPKIPAVRSGDVRQTVRPIVFAFRDKKHRLCATPKPIMPGDIILFHGWQGKPYRSPWSWRLKVLVDEMLYLKIYKEGISRPQERHWQLNCPTHRLGFMPWSECDELAKQDGIKDGETMGRVFNGMYRLEIYNDNGMDMGATKYFQIIRWSWPPLESNSLVGESQ